MRLTEKQIEAGRSPAGGFTRKQLAAWGVPWPPPRGWKRALLAGKPIPKRRNGGQRKKRVHKAEKAARNWMDRAFAATIAEWIAVWPAKTAR